MSFRSLLKSFREVHSSIPRLWLFGLLLLGLLPFGLGCSDDVPLEERRALAETLNGHRALRPRLSGGLPHRPCPAAETSSLRCRSNHTLFPAAVSVKENEATLSRQRRHTQALAWIVGVAEEPEEDHKEDHKEDTSLEIGIRMLDSLLTAPPSGKNPAPAWDPALSNDLAAALLVRGEDTESGLDLVRALDLVVGAPGTDEALFNRALACETLVGTSFCAPLWQEAEAASGAGWNGEIQGHLELAQGPTPEERWQVARVLILEAADRGEDTALRELVDPHRTPTRFEVEGPILAAWGAAVLEDRPEDADRQLRRARHLAAALQDLTGDPLLVETVEVLTAAAASAITSPIKGPSQLRLLAQGHVDHGRGLGLDRTGEWDNGLHFRKARKAFQAAGSPFRFWADLGVVLTSLRDLDLDLQAFEKIFTPLLATAQERGYGALRARALWLRAFLYQDWGHPLSMLEGYQASLEAYEALGEEDEATNVRARLADALSIMGAAGQSWELRYRALRHQSRLHQAERRHYVLGSTAQAAANEGFLDAALLLQRAALQEARKDPRLLNAPIALRALAEVHLAREEMSAARATLKQARGALDAIGASPESQRRLAVDSRIEEIAGDLLLESTPTEAPTEAAEAYRLSIDALAGTDDRRRLPTLYLKLSRALAARERHHEAEAHLQTALALVQEQWHATFAVRQPGERERELEKYFLSSREIFEELIRLLVETGNGEEALGVLEQVRARELLALTGVFVDSPPEPMNVQQLQASLPTATTLVAYEVLSDQVVAWAVPTDGEIRVASLPLSRTQLRGQIQDLQRGFQRQASTNDLRGALQTLHEELIRPLRSSLTPGDTLVVVPDEDLSLLPFSALLDPTTDRYLIQDHPIALAPSGTLFAFSRDRDEALAAGPRGGALLVANPAVDLAPLPGAEAEVARLARLYPEPLVLEGARATRDRFLEELPLHEVVHYAGHAVVSVLALAAAEGGGSNPPSSGISSADILRRSAVEGANSRTRLLVLAACTSLGSGEGSAGLELSSFARPFLGSGVPALVGSLWDLKDGQSEDLMFAFHGFLSTEADAAHALRKAQLELLESGDRSRSSLSVWAAFQLVGFTTTQREEN